MQDAFGQNAFGMSCRPPRRRWTRQTPTQTPTQTSTGGRGRLPAYVAPGLTATVLVALILHLLAELASRLTFGDPAGALSVAVGMAAVLVILLPFTALCARRAHLAWCRVESAVKPRPPVGFSRNPR